MIAIIDYDAGNIKSVEKAMIHLGQDVCITRDNGFLQQTKLFFRVWEPLVMQWERFISTDWSR